MQSCASSEQRRQQTPIVKYLKKNTMKIVFFTLVLACLIVLNILLEPIMNYCSNILVTPLQKQESSAVYDFSRFGIYVSQPQTYILVITIVGIFVSRQSAFYYLVSYSVTIVFRVILRLSFQRARPFMMVDDLKPPVCLETFG